MARVQRPAEALGSTAKPEGLDSFLRNYLGFTPGDIASWFESDDATSADGDAPLPERLVSDAETLRAISDPTRLRILETMVTRTDVPWSVKELAAVLDVPQTRLYHHVELLLERELIRSAGQRLVSGIVETRYRVAALSLRLDPHLLVNEGASTEALVSNVIDSARGELLAALRLAVPPDPDRLPADRPLVTRAMARLTPERAAELRARLLALLEEFDDVMEPSAVPYSLLLAYYPTPMSAATKGGEPE